MSTINEMFARIMGEEPKSEEERIKALRLCSQPEDWHSTFFETASGMRVFYDLLEICDFWEDYFYSNQKDAYFKGMKKVVLTIIKISRLRSWDGLHRILRIEANEAQKENNHDG